MARARVGAEGRLVFDACSCDEHLSPALKACHSRFCMSSVTSDVCKGGGGVYLLYLRSCAFKYRYILYS
jgi:hypothetical protein